MRELKEILWLHSKNAENPRLEHEAEKVGKEYITVQKKRL